MDESEAWTVLELKRAVRIGLARVWDCAAVQPNSKHEEVAVLVGLSCIQCLGPTSECRAVW
jgi:hypothetical protein